MYNFKINTKFTNFKFTPMEEIEKSNNDIGDNLNSDTEFIMAPGQEKKKTGPSRKSSHKSKESNSDSVSSKIVTASQASRIKKVSKDIVNDLMKK